MNNNQIEFKEGNPNVYIISVNKSPLIVRAILLIILILFALIPVMATYFRLSSGYGFHFGLALSFVLCWLIGFYLLRIVLWNTYGKEKLEFNDSIITYEADYKFFKDGKKELENKRLTIDINKIPEEKKDIGTLVINNELDQIITVIKLPIEKLKEIENKINENGF